MIEPSSNKLKARASAKASKRDARKRQLADSALVALGRYGYANTSMRDIAEQAGLSLGLLHYYFEDKDHLLIDCVSRYKDGFITSVDAVLQTLSAPEARMELLARHLARTLTTDAATHRLWYDIRIQSTFNDVFAPMVTSIEQRLVDLMRHVASEEKAACERLYVGLDGLFLHCLEKLLEGQPLAVADMEAAFIDVMQRLR